MGSIIRHPSVSVTTASAPTAVENTAQKVLIFGQGDQPNATYTADALYENVGNNTATNEALFGPKSQVSAMLRRFKEIAPQVQVDVIAIDDDDGTPTDRTFTVVATGTASAAGTFTMRVGGESYETTVAIASGTTNTAATAAIDTAITAEQLNAPFTNSDSSGTITFVSTNAGSIAQETGMEIIFDTPGITWAMTQTVIGATDPTLTNLLDVIGERRYQAIVWPYSQDNTEVLRVLDARFNSTDVISDGVAFTCAAASHQNLLSDLGTAGNNSESLVFFGDLLLVNNGAATSPFLYGPGQNMPSYEKSAVFAAIRALRLTEGAGIANYVVTSSSRDQTGGPATASLPYANTPLDAMPTVLASRGFTQLEMSQLKDAGGSVMGINSAGDGAICGEVVTTYLTNGAGAPDVTYTNLNYVDTISGVREYYFNNLAARFAQTRLTTGTITPGRSMANEDSIRSYCMRLYQDLAGPDYTLVVDGEDAIRFFDTNLSIVIDMAAGSATIAMQIPIITQLRSIVATIQIVFSTT